MPARTFPNLDDLLRVLEAATDKQALRWAETADEDTFRAEFGRGMVRIGKSPDTAGYVLTLIDQDGTIVDESQPLGEGEQNALSQLYKKVRRQALNLDERLKALFGHLKSLAGET
jgi:hypothetical protein